MSIVSKGGLVALLLVMVAVAATGCMGGTASNPGWTVVNAADKVVYAALATGKVVALDAAKGEEVWGYPLPQQRSGGLGGLFSGGGGGDDAKPLDAVYGVPVVTDKLLLVASYDHHLYAFDRASGRKVWSFTANEAIIGGPTVYEGVVYFGSSDHLVRALNVETGEPAWPKPFATQNWVWGAPAVDAKRVYVGSMDHNVYAINRQTGEKVWQRDIGGSIPGAVTLADGTLFAGGVDKQLHALNAETGEVRWARDLGHWVMGEALVQGDYVYVGTLDAKVHAFKIANGAPRWDAVSVDNAVRAGPVLWGNSLIVCTNAGSIYRIEAETGRSELLFKAPGPVLSTPKVVGDMIYVGTAMGEVLALDASLKGDPQVWVYPPRKK